MSSLAIPAAPPPATPGTANGASPAAADGRFGDALRETQGRSQTQASGHAADNDPPRESIGEKRDAGKHDRSKDDDHAAEPGGAKHSDPSTDVAQPLPAAAPLAPPMAATARQSAVAGGKPLPAAALKGAGLAMASTAPAQTEATLANTHTPAPGGVQTATQLEAASGAGLTARNTSTEADTQTDAGGGKEAPSPRLTPNDFTAQLTQLVAAHAAPPAANHVAAPVQLAMQATPQQMPQFAQETAQHVAWLAGQGIQKAEIRLNPGKLGPIHVEIATHDDRVDVNFAVQHPQTVNALQQTLPQLQHMLAQQGLNLGQASVGQQAPGQQHAAFAQHGVTGGSGHDTGNAESQPPPGWRSLRIATPGRVDDFA